MPHRDTYRQFISGGYYHVYNRGNAKKVVFRSEQDYEIFSNILASYLLPQKSNTRQWQRKDFSSTIDIVAFVLMPNHFHFLIQQHDDRSIAGFLRCITQVYARHYNTTYGSIGHVFQGCYKARLIHRDTDLLHLTRYIHCNPKNITNDLISFPYSSLQYYCQGGGPAWLKTQNIFDIFQSVFGISPQNVHESYRLFLQSYALMERGEDPD